jgi:hypothetical protein
VILDNDRLSHWFAGAVLGWAVSLPVLWIPIFHLWLGAPIAKVAICAGIACASQLAITPWLFSARATPQNPGGNIARRSVVVIVWISVFCLALFSYVLGQYPRNPSSKLLWSCMLGTVIVFGLGGLLAVRVIFRQRPGQ